MVQLFWRINVCTKRSFNSLVSPMNAAKAVRLVLAGFTNESFYFHTTSLCALPKILWFCRQVGHHKETNLLLPRTACPLTGRPINPPYLQQLAPQILHSIEDSSFFL